MSIDPIQLYKGLAKLIIVDIALNREHVARKTRAWLRPGGASGGWGGVRDATALRPPASAG